MTGLNGIPITTPARTLLDLAAAAPEMLERAFAIAERRASFTRDELQRILARHPRHAGARAVRTLLLAETPPAFTRSEAEARLLDLVRRARLPAPATNARLRGFEVDFYWKQQRLVAEVDGYAYHSSFAAFERDRRRDAALLTAGIRTIRFTWRQIEQEPLPTIAQLAQALVQ